MRAQLGFVVVAIVSALVAGCGASGSASGGSPAASPAPVGSPKPAASLEYALIDRFGPPWYCDPDAYPIGRDEEQQAIARWPEVQRDEETLNVIRARLGMANGAFTNAQKLAVYREWKRLGAVVLDPVGNGRYRFDYRAEPAQSGGEGTRTAGLIDAAGGIDVEQQSAATAPNCPICLDAAAPVDTPLGPVAVAGLVDGAPVWTVDSSGRRVVAFVLAVRSVEAPVGHELVHLVLADGRELLASPGHPLADGRALGDLAPGDVVNGSTVATATRVASGPRTWDLLPSGGTGIYLVDGIALRSTLAG
jgi:hypothetical protein